jgi:hypothetical protein
MKPNTVRTSVDIPRDLHLRLKKVAAERGCSKRQLILRSIEIAVETPEPKKKRRLDLSKPLVSSRGKVFGMSNREINELIEAP